MIGISKIYQSYNEQGPILKWVEAEGRGTEWKWRYYNVIYFGNFQMDYNLPVSYASPVNVSYQWFYSLIWFDNAHVPVCIILTVHV